MTEFFCDVFSEYLARANKTPGDLADLTGIPRPTLEAWKGGVVGRPRRWQDIAKVACALWLSIPDFDRLLQAANHPLVDNLIELARTKQDTESLRLLSPWAGGLLSPQNQYSQRLPSNENGYQPVERNIPKFLRQETELQPDRLAVPSAGLVSFSKSSNQAMFSPLITIEKRNRDSFLQNVYNTWIKGFLHQSLSKTIALELKLAYRPDMLLRKTLIVPGRDQEQPIEGSIREIFDNYGRALLILGDPGSGKTISLLQLAESLIVDAQQNSAQPMPVVLNLSSWGEKRRKFVEWLIEEIVVQYQVARKLSRTWIENDQLCFLLDGLDEVAEGSREECVTAINEFKAQHQVEMVVCSRIANYQNLINRLNLTTAICIQPLNEAQIQAYLNRKELKLEAIMTLLESNAGLRELAQSPLMLGMMTVAYCGLTTHDLEHLDSPKAWQHHLFAKYVECVFARRLSNGNKRYNQEEAEIWLANLARSMCQHNQTVFYLEQLQFSWLPTLSFDLYYDLLGSLIFGFTGGIIFGLISGLLDGLMLGMIIGPIIGLIFRLITRRKAYSKFMSLVGLVFSGLLFGLIVWKAVGLGGMICGLIFLGLFFLLPIKALILSSRIESDEKSSKGLKVRKLGVPDNVIQYSSKIVTPDQQSLITYLDDMVDYTLLRRVGRGWVFIHHSLLEYFASLYLLHPDEVSNNENLP